MKTLSRRVRRRSLNENPGVQRRRAAPVFKTRRIKFRGYYFPAGILEWYIPLVIYNARHGVRRFGENICLKRLKTRVPIVLFFGRRELRFELQW